MNKDAHYYSRRVQEEKKAAQKSVHPMARQRHLELANAYEQRVRSIFAEQARMTFRLVSAA